MRISDWSLDVCSSDLETTMILRNAILPALLAAAIAFPAAAAEPPEKIKAAGKVIIASMPNYPPITYKDPATNTLKGFDIELGEAIAKEMGVKVEWQEIALEIGRAHV